MGRATLASPDACPVLSKEGAEGPGVSVQVASLWLPPPPFCSRGWRSSQAKLSPKCCRECLVLGDKGCPEADRKRQCLSC